MESEQFVGLRRALAGLADADRVARRRSAARLADQVCGLNSDGVEAVFLQVLDGAFWVLADDQERVRESTATALLHLLQSASAELIDERRKAILSALRQRCCASATPAEGCEEVRLLLARMLSVLLKRLAPVDGDAPPSAAAAGLEDASAVCASLLVDAFADVRREAAAAVRFLCSARATVVHLHAERLLLACIGSLRHQHARVRRAALEAAGDVVAAGAPWTCVLENADSLAVLVDDRHQGVRECAAGVFGRWLGVAPQDLDELRSVIVHWLLTLLGDEHEVVRAKALEAIDSAAVLYVGASRSEGMTENSDATDCCAANEAMLITEYAANTNGNGNGTAAASALHGAAGEQRARAEHQSRVLVAPFCSRGADATRALLRSVAPRLVPVLVDEAGAWKEERRASAVTALARGIYLLEDSATRYASALVSALTSALSDSARQVRSASRLALSVLSQAVDPDAYAPGLARRAALGEPTAVAAIATMAVTASAGRLRPHALGLAKSLAAAFEHGEATGDAALVNEVAHASSALALAVGGQHPSDADAPALPDSIWDILGALALRLGGNEGVALLRTVSQSRGDEDDGSSLALSRTSELLAAGAPARAVAAAIGCQISPPALHRILETIVSDMEQKNGDPVAIFDAMDVVQGLATACGDGAAGDALRLRACDLLRTVVVPHLAWRAGRAFGKVRAAAARCAYELVARNFVTQDDLLSLADELCTKMTAALDDGESSVRALAIASLSEILARVPAVFGREKIMTIYPELLKRLDDSSDDIRAQVCGAIARLMCLTSTEDFPGSHAESVADALIIHMDDANEVVRSSVGEAVRLCARVHPRIWAEKLDGAVQRFRHRAEAEHVRNTIRA